MITYVAHKNFHARICMFTAHGAGEKEADSDSFILAHHKKHNKLSTHTVVLTCHNITRTWSVLLLAYCGDKDNDYKPNADSLKNVRHWSLS